MELINLSAEPLGKLYSWIPNNLEYEKIVFFPDACPGKSPLPTGTAVLTKQENWRKFAISDIGCGMMFLESQLTIDDFNKKDWDRLAYKLKENKGKNGDLKSGNHFLDMIVSNKDGRIYFLIHTGSRNEGHEIDTLVNNPVLFDKEYERIINAAIDNRMAIKTIIDKIYGETSIVLDKIHNSFEVTQEDSVLIRKGSVSLKEGELSVIPSNMDGEVILIKGKASINNCLNSISHGTGRVFSRSEAKDIAERYDYKALRDRIYIPEIISDASIKTEAPFCYRYLGDCMLLINDIVEETERYNPIAYIGQL